MSRTSEALMGEIAGPVVLLLQALDVLEFVARHLHPPSLDALLYESTPKADPLREALAGFGRAEWPEELLPFRGRLESAAQAT